MLTLFGVLTLEGWLEVLDETRAVGDWAVPYFVSFILVDVFVVVNLVIDDLERHVAGDGPPLAKARRPREAADQGWARPGLAPVAPR